MTDTEVGATSDPVAQFAGYVSIDAARSGSTIAFGFVLLTLMVLMPCLVLFVAIAAFRAKRKVEPSFMSWMGAMLFATIPLRTFLPGSPPIGSWIDFLVVLWVVVGLISGLAIYVAAWWKWGARSDRADRQQRPSPPASSDGVPRPPMSA
jgi:phage shock protein PspC (stress-responsive transcriptional regulator)